MTNGNIAAMPGVPVEAVEAAIEAGRTSLWKVDSEGIPSNGIEAVIEAGLAAALPSLREQIAAEVLAPDKIERQYAYVVTAILRVLDDTEWDGWPEPAKWRLRQRIVNAVRDAVKTFAAPVFALSAPVQAAEPRRPRERDFCIRDEECAALDHDPGCPEYDDLPSRVQAAEEPQECGALSKLGMTPPCGQAKGHAGFHGTFVQMWSHDARDRPAEEVDGDA